MIRSKIIKLFSIVVLLFFLDSNSVGITQLQIVSKNVSSNILIVDDEGDGDYESIQEAVDNAKAGDVIRIYSGVYREHVIIKKRVVLEGISFEYGSGDDTGRPVVDGSDRGDVVVIEASGCEINGLKIVRSGREYSMKTGVKILSDNCLIHNNTLEDNFIGISASASKNCTFRDNLVLYNIFGIHLSHPIGCNVINNRFYNSGLIVLASSGEILTNTIVGNWVNNKPISFYIGISNRVISGLTCGEMILIDCKNVTVENLRAKNTSVGLIVENCSSLKVCNSIFENIHRGGISLHGKNCEIYNNTFYNCSYGCYLEGGMNFYIHHNNFIMVFKHDQPTLSWIKKHQTFVESENIVFDRNYWDDWIGLKHQGLRFIPKVIPGFRKYWHKVLNIFPVFVFDKNPALTPYNNFSV